MRTPYKYAWANVFARSMWSVFLLLVILFTPIVLSGLLIVMGVIGDTMPPRGNMRQYLRNNPMPEAREVQDYEPVKVRQGGVNLQPRKAN